TILVQGDGWGRHVNTWGFGPDRMIADRVAEAGIWFRDLALALEEMNAVGDAPGEDPAPAAPADLPDLVTLDQAAASAHKSKRTLERYKSEGTLPQPTVEGGGGKSALYDWKVMRPWLGQTFGMKLPERFPGNVR